FGKSSEKSDQQVELFDEVECEADASAVDTAESIDAESLHSALPLAETPKPVKKTSGRKPLPAELPRVRIEHDLPLADKICA
ncbi:transposase, partial [Oceanobacter antarcticus]